MEKRAAELAEERRLEDEEQMEMPKRTEWMVGEGDGALRYEDWMNQNAEEIAGYDKQIERLQEQLKEAEGRTFDTMNIEDRILELKRERSELSIARQVVEARHDRPEELEMSDYQAYKDLFEDRSSLLMEHPDVKEKGELKIKWGKLDGLEDWLGQQALKAAMTEDAVRFREVQKAQELTWKIGQMMNRRSEEEWNEILARYKEAEMKHRMAESEKPGNETAA